VRVGVADGDLHPQVEVVELQHLPVKLEVGLLLLQVEQEQDGFPQVEEHQTILRLPVEEVKLQHHVLVRLQQATHPPTQLPPPQILLRPQVKHHLPPHNNIVLHHPQQARPLP